MVLEHSEKGTVVIEPQLARIFTTKRRGGLTIYFVEQGSPDKLTTLLCLLNQEELDKVTATYSGVFWIFQAIALNEINCGNITYENIWNIDLEELLLLHFS